MIKLVYSYKEKKRASTMLALAQSEYEAAKVLIAEKLYKEAVVHLYFTCFYIAHAMLAQHVAANVPHKSLEAKLHEIYGRLKVFPRSYIKLHSRLHIMRTEYDYRNSYSPDPENTEKELQRIQRYLKFALKVVPKIETQDIISGIYNDNGKLIKDFSYDIYCPKTYFHHVRITFWQPPIYLKIFSYKKLISVLKKTLHDLRIKKYDDYVIGINSKLDQYSNIHLLMLDIDSINPAIEKALEPYGGILLKSGRGYHFIGKNLIIGDGEFRRTYLKILRDKKLKNAVDKNHIEISLKRGYSTLRITANSIKPQIPFFYKEL